MKQIKIKDNSKYLKEELNEVAEITSRITNKSLDQLAKEGVFVFPETVKDSEDLSRDQMILQTQNDSVFSSNVMGFIGCGNQRLVIESRFSSGTNDFFFQYLIENVLDIPNIVDLETNVNYGDNCFNILLFLFPKYLSAAIRKGLFKTYINTKHNDENVKGSIDVARHIKDNTPFLGKVAYSQREFVHDNYLIELIRHTIEHIKKKQFGNIVLNKCKDECKQIIEVSANFKFSDKHRIVELNNKNIVRHAYYHEYRDLQKLCILILQEQKHQIGIGDDKIYGVLFDGSWLWEEYVNKLIAEHFYHPMNKAGSGAQWLFSSGNGLIYPDFIGKDAEDRVIADAKYKPNYNIGNKDYLQLLAYMFRFDAKIGFYLYPESEEKAVQRMWLNQGNSYDYSVSARDDIYVEKIGFFVPKDEGNYIQFVDAIRKSEMNFINCLLR